MEIPTDIQQPYFNTEMREEFHIAVAKREALRILRHVEYHKKALLVSKLVDSKYSPTVIGS